MDDATRGQDQLEGISYTTDTVQELLRGVTFPIDADALARHLETQDAPPSVVESLRTSDVTRFEGIEEVMDVIGGFAV